MSGTALTLAAVAALVVAPECGGVPRGTEFADRVVSTILWESGDRRVSAEPFVIGVNEPGARPIVSASSAEAAAQARALVAAGKDFDAGLGQINVRNLARHGLTLETVFDDCRNVRATVEHLAQDYDAAWTAAHRRYNTGKTDTTARGATYAAGVEQVLARVRGIRAGAPSPLPSVGVLALPAESLPPRPFGVLVRRSGPVPPDASAAPSRAAFSQLVNGKDN